ncbi:CLIP3 [Symbiodinium sp. CCMP2592]|nr:CLIP3 [Symbiodinium sp. CCMP2592]
MAEVIEALGQEKGTELVHSEQLLKAAIEAEAEAGRRQGKVFRGVAVAVEVFESSFTVDGSDFYDYMASSQALGANVVGICGHPGFNSLLSSKSSEFSFAVVPCLSSPAVGAMQLQIPGEEHLVPVSACGDAMTKQEEKTGTIRFLGTTSFSEGEWVGLELEDDGGKNDGEVRGQRYFTCPPQRGLFMRPTMVKLPAPAPTEEGQDGEVSLRLQLAEAVEENNVGAIEGLLWKAEAEGVPQEEIDLAQRRLAYLQTSEIVVEDSDSAEEEPPKPKPQLIDLLGGEEEVKKHQAASRTLQQKVVQMVKENEDPASQPAIYQGMGLEHMLQSSVRFKKDFDDVCHKFAKHIQDNGYDVSFMAASIKSLASAASKVNTEYHGDCRQLKDVVRGTLVIKSGKDGTAPSVAAGYEILQMLVEDEGRFLESANARFTRFSDRYQKPVGAAKYRDWLLLLKIGDFVCELQVNFEQAVQVKEEEQHHKYELQRLATRKLLESAMRNDYGMVHLLLASNGLHGESLVNARDCHGFTPLHYAARHGNALMLELLLGQGANVLALDRDGLPPLHHALAMVHPEACQKFLTVMDDLPKELLRKEPLASNLQSLWGSALHSNSEAKHGLAGKMAEVAKRAYSTPAQHLQAIARSGDVPAMRAAYKTLPQDYVILGWASVPYDFVECGTVSMLDLAILSGSAAMAAMVAKPDDHGAPKIYEGDDYVIDFLFLHDEPKQVERLVRQGKVARFRALHSVHPPDTRRMAELLVLAAEHDQLEMAHQIWTLGGGDLASSLTDEEKEKLVGLGMQAAALGHEDFVRLLIEAEAPIDKRINDNRMIEQAARAGQTALVQLLADAGANIRHRVLDKAVEFGHYDTAETLLKRGANPKESWDDGSGCDSVIGQAIIENRPEMLHLLAQYGADTYTDENLEYAEEMQAFDCLEFMRRSREGACPA